MKSIYIYIYITLQHVHVHYPAVVIHTQKMPQCMNRSKAIHVELLVPRPTFYTILESQRGLINFDRNRYHISNMWALKFKWFLCLLCHTFWWLNPSNGFPHATDTPSVILYTWWRHLMEAFSALLALCVGHRWISRTKDNDAELWWFETPSRPLWRHCNESN